MKHKINLPVIITVVSSMKGLNNSMALSFMVVGHTKFTPNSCFGILKQAFHPSHIQSLSQLADVVSHSSTCKEFEVVVWEGGVPLIPTMTGVHSFQVT